MIQGFNEHSKQLAIPAHEQLAQQPFIQSLNEMQHGRIHI